MKHRKKSPRTIERRAFYDHAGAAHYLPKGKRARFRPSIYLLMVDQVGRILFVKNRGHDGWGFPGGGGRPGEAIALTAMRETLEETGAIIWLADRKPFCFYERYFYVKKYGCMHALTFGFVIGVHEQPHNDDIVNKIKAGKHPETIKMKWIDPRTLSKKDVFVGFHPMLQVYFDQNDHLRPLQDGGWK